MGIILHAFSPVKGPSKSLTEGNFRGSKTLAETKFCAVTDLMEVCKKYSTDQVIEELHVTCEVNSHLNLPNETTQKRAY